MMMKSRVISIVLSLIIHEIKNDVLYMIKINSITTSVISFYFSYSSLFVRIMCE